MSPQVEVSNQGEIGPPKKQKQLACKRCRHRKQKCTEIRPCENCTQSGSECIPSESATSKPLLEADYVQRLEERVAQLEAFIPQESLDHINATHDQSRPISASRANIQPTIEAPFPPSHDHRVEAALPGSSARYAAGNLNTSPSLPDEPLDHLNNGLFGAVPGIYSQYRPTVQDESLLEPPEMGLELEHFLIQTYFDMAHSQYPILMKHEFLQWAESWHVGEDALPPSVRWKGFFVYMVYAIAFLMTKSRINGPTRSRTLYALATSKYLPYVMESPSALIRAQGFLLLTLYALHVPSLETIITLSARAIRFCVASQLHLVETEQQPLNSDALMQIQHRRRVFWCAYAMDRVVCSAYDLPCSVSDNHITLPMFENIDDDQLSSAAASVQRGSQLLASSAPTGISSALHIIVGRQIESEIQEMVLRKDFAAESGEAFIWRAEMLEKLKQWNRGSITSTVPTHKGYVSLRWHKMIYYYGIVMLYRPTRTSAQGISGDLSVQACCQALLLFRKFQMAREIAQPWLGLLTQFQIGVTLLYCFFATPPSHWPSSYKSSDVPDAIRACSSILAVLAERWTEAECIRDTFETLAKEIPLGETWERPRRISDAGRTIIEDNRKAMSGIVIHRPTLRMIHEMATDEFVDPAEVNSGSGINRTPTAAPEAATSIFDGMDLQWVNPMHTSSLEMRTIFYLENGMEAFPDGTHFHM
ncbi:Transcriptional activator protein acu [Pleurostoma richardsiae]|uniref:Transcriptional activator protein acu n=1 Tax=Pleurostoma richardsiae TaxID=41990 RepID=A0AA38VK35_9PEZI|nr:Transcriptional activator protein acu [Pleurostoma richardsiae]